MKDVFLELFYIQDKKILNLLHKTLVFSFAIILLSILILNIFLKNNVSFKFFYVSIEVFKIGLFIEVSAIMSALIINMYNKKYHS